MKTGRNEGRKEKKIDKDRKGGAGHAGGHPGVEGEERIKILCTHV